MEAIRDMDNAFATKQLKLKPVNADGTCLFHAVHEFYNIPQWENIDELSAFEKFAGGNDGHSLRQRYTKMALALKNNYPQRFLDSCQATVQHVLLYYPEIEKENVGHPGFEESQAKGLSAVHIDVALMAELLDRPIYVYNFVVKPVYGRVPDPEIYNPSSEAGRKKEPIRLALWKRGGAVGHFDLSFPKKYEHILI